MAQKLGDLGKYFDPGLTLTVLGKEYQVPLASAELGLWVRLCANAAGDINAASSEQEMRAAIERLKNLPELPGGKDVTLEERVLGDVYQQMVDDQVADAYIQFCGATAYVWILAGEDKAAAYWQSGGRPEAPRPANRQARRAETRGQTSTAAGTATRSPASTSGTKSPRKSSGNTAAKAASPGRRSSPTG